MFNATRPSAAKYWVKCTGWAAQTAGLPDVSGLPALEGTAAHSLAETVLKGEVGNCSELIDRQDAKTGLMFTEEMADAAQFYCDYMTGMFKNNIAEINIKVNDFVQGTADTANYSYQSIGGTLHVVDFKYGWGIVEPDFNFQLLCYASGIARQLNRRVEFITLHIVQPRPWHHIGKVRTWTIPIQQAEEYFALIDQKSFEANMPNAPLTAGEHCKNCTAFLKCEAVRRLGLNAIDITMHQQQNIDIPLENLGQELELMERTEAIIQQRRKALESEVLEQTKVGKMPGYSIITGQARDKWTDKAAAIGAGQSLNIDMVSTLITPSAARKAGLPDVVVDGLSEKGVGGLKAIKTDINAKASKIFGDN